MFKFLILIILSLPFCISLDTLTPDQSIKEGQSFISKVTQQTVVWVANRNDPINDSSGVLSINQYGILVLHDSSNRHLWSTNVSVQGTISSVAQLQDSGNLLLIQDSFNEKVLWQSCDHPTDTLLPKMKLGLNRITGLDRFLTSWKSQDDPGTGDCMYKMNPSGNPQVFLYKEPLMADSPTSNGPQPPSSPQFPSPLMLLSNMSNLMSIKLDSLNYMFRSQVNIWLILQGVLTTGVNPSFLSWKKRDKALLTLIYSTLSPPVLSMVVGLHSAQEVWSTLETRFTSTARANVLNLKLELQSVKKVGVQIDDEEMLHMVLKGLPKDYSSFNSAIRTRDDSLTFEKLSVLLQTEELSINESSELNSSLAMFVSNTNRQTNGSSNYNRGRGRNHYSRGGRGNGRSGHFYPQNQFTQNHSPGSQGQNQSGFHGQTTNSYNKPEHNRPTCQICGKLGHYAIDCYHRMDFAYQGKNPPTKLAAMANASNLNMTQGTGKMHKLPFSISVPKSEFPLHVLHADLWGPAPIQSYNGFRYYLVIVDDYTKFCWVYLLKNKSDTFTTFQQFKVMAEKHYNSSIHFLRTDCGGEFTSTAFNSYCANSGIIHHLTCPHTPQQNGVAERKHRHLIQITLALLSQSGLSLSYWSYAIATACHLINKLPTPLLNMSSPWEQLHHVKPDIFLS
uniref:Integrase catalytic domain-containing protein n=1 Tax=Fagus sylvatica TaxID=28930 RepID=A0A2N9G0H4_FAGSY